MNAYLRTRQEQSWQQSDITLSDGQKNWTTLINIIYNFMLFIAVSHFALITTPLRLLLVCIRAVLINKNILSA